MAIYVNGVLVAGDGVDGKDATINGVNTLRIQTKGGINNRQEDDTLYIDGYGLVQTGRELNGTLIPTAGVAAFESLNGTSITFDRDAQMIEFVLENTTMLTVADGVIVLANGYSPRTPYSVSTKKYVDDIVGNINTLLDTINGEVI